MLTTEEAGELIGISETTVRTHIRRGRIEAKKRGRQWWIHMDEAIRYRDRPQKTGRPKKEKERAKEECSPAKASPAIADTPEER